MALQAIGRLSQEFPDAAFDYLVSDECRALVEGSPVIRRTFILPRQNLRQLSRGGDLTQALRVIETLLEDISRHRYSLSLNLFQGNTGGLLQSFVQAEKKAGLDLCENRNFRIESRYLEHLAAIPVSRRENGWHVTDLYIRSARQALGGKGATPLSHPTKSRPVLPALPQADCASELIPGKFLAFHPGAAWIGKRWPEKKWALLAEICHQAGLTIAFTGAPEERPAMDRIKAEMTAATRSSIVDTVGKTGLLEAGWVLANADLVVTGDTVAMHLAAASGTRTLALFGPSNPVETGPYGPGHTVVQTEPFPETDLAFECEHAGLTTLDAESIGAYILSGQPPQNTQVWQTEWDAELGVQILTDRQHTPHPNHFRGQSLIRCLDAQRQENDQESLPNSESTITAALVGSRAALWQALEAATEKPISETLMSLETAETKLANATQNSLIWEAYRIAINGLPIRNLSEYLNSRKQRFILALREEQAIQEYR